MFFAPMKKINITSCDISDEQRILFSSPIGNKLSKLNCQTSNGKNNISDIISVSFEEVTLGFVCDKCKTGYIGEWMLPNFEYNPQNDIRHPNNNKKDNNYLNSKEFEEYRKDEAGWLNFFNELDILMSPVMNHINATLNEMKCQKCTNNISLNEKNSFVMLPPPKYIDRSDKYFTPFIDSNCEMLDMYNYIDYYDTAINRILGEKKNKKLINVSANDRLYFNKNTTVNIPVPYVSTSQNIIAEIENDTPDCLKEPCTIYIYNINKHEFETVGILRNYFSLELLEAIRKVDEASIEGSSIVSGYVLKHELNQLLSELDEIGVCYKVL